MNPNSRTLLLLFLLMLIGFGAVCAQRTGALSPPRQLEAEAAYFSLALGKGTTGIAGGYSANLLFNNRWGSSLSMRQYGFQSPNLPQDFEPGFLSNSLSQPWENDLTMDRIKTVSLKIVRTIPTRDKNLRLGFEAGPSWTRYQERIYIPLESSLDGNIQTPSHTSNFKTHHSVGAEFRAKLEFPVSKWMGLEVATLTHLNKHQSYFGVEAAVSFGKVRN